VPKVSKAGVSGAWPPVAWLIPAGILSKVFVALLQPLQLVVGFGWRKAECFKRT
jgi:hypothetical protein